MIILDVLSKLIPRFNRLILYVFGLCFFLPLMILQAEAQYEDRIPYNITTFQLENGLHIILSEDYSLPLVAVAVAYNVGSINEQPNKTGLAYLLENVMFQGSKNIGHMQHINFIQKIGGNLNAVTTEDKTIFFQTVPSNQLALVLWLESDRMMSLNIDEQKVTRIKGNLIGEIQNRKTSDPYFDSNLYFDRLLYPNETYSHPVIGRESDLRDIMAEDVRNFYGTYYSPNNAVLCITGNFDKRKSIALIKKYFESIPRKINIPSLSLASHRNIEESVNTLENYTAQSPAFHLGYTISPPNSDDFYALTIIEYLLLRGRSSRLYNKLIQKDRTARQLNGGIEIRKNLATFKIFVRSGSNTMMERTKKTVFSEINNLKSELVSEKELNRAKNMFKMDYISRYAKLVDRAVFLVETYLSKNSLDDLPGELSKYLSVSPATVIGIANRYFTKNRTLLYIKIK